MAAKQKKRKEQLRQRKKKQEYSDWCGTACLSGRQKSKLEGKSTLLSTITSANPKIANYKFTTLNPNLGVAIYDDKEITLADIPGLIEGAHEGVGLGIKFLKHIERCKILLHMIDTTEDDLITSYKQIRNELKKYSNDLVKKKEIIVFNKVDLIEKNELKEKIKFFEGKIKKKMEIGI